MAATCPNEDRSPDRPVFPVTSEQALRNTMARACRIAEIPLYSPHDLRHRRITLWHFGGVPVREIQERVGHARASVTLDRYSHVMPVDEIAPEVILEVLRRRIPSPGPLHVMTR
ncbi:MAG: tyrosine-type recombinase/integrase [Gaiellaceae bacterium]